MLGLAERRALPVAYADWYGEPDPGCLPTTAGFNSGLPMPPCVEGIPDAGPDTSEDGGGGSTGHKDVMASIEALAQLFNCDAEVHSVTSHHAHPS
jgi:hypothetical protein